MRKLILLLRRLHLWLIFLVLEGFSLYMFFHTDTYMYSKYLSVCEWFTGYADGLASNINTYLYLKEENKVLLKLNSDLLAENLYLKSRTETYASESLVNYKPGCIVLRVLRNEFLNDNNYIVLDGGENDGVKKGMAVLSNLGIVGYVTAVSSNYSVVVSLLSMDNFLSSAKIKDTSFSGTLMWNGQQYNVVQMIEVPKYANIHVGDTILTTSYSNVFPEDIPIGTISDITLNDDTFYKADVKTFVDFSALENVYLLEMINKEERDSLEIISGVKTKTK